MSDGESTTHQTVTIEALDAGFSADASNPQIQAAFARFVTTPEVVDLDTSFSSSNVQGIVIDDLVYFIVPSEEDTSVAFALFDGNSLIRLEYYVFRPEEDILFARSVLDNKSVFIRDMSTYDPSDSGRMELLSDKLLPLYNDSLASEVNSIGLQSGTRDIPPLGCDNFAAAGNICEDLAMNVRDAAVDVRTSHIFLGGSIGALYTCAFQGLWVGAFTFATCTGLALFSTIGTGIDLAVKQERLTRAQNAFRDCLGEAANSGVAILAYIEPPVPFIVGRILRDGFTNAQIGFDTYELGSLTGAYEALNKSLPLAIAAIPVEYSYRLDELDIDPLSELVRLPIYTCDDPDDID